MAYGRKVSSDNTVVSPEVGIVENVSMDSQFKLNEDSTFAIISFFQQNGAKVDRRIYDSDKEEEQETTDRVIKHICTKIVSEEAYENATKAPCNSFTEFINLVNRLIAGKTTTERFRMIFHYNNKGYVTVSKYPNFIENMKVPVEESKLKISPYVSGYLVRPNTPKPDAEPAQKEDLLF